MCDPKTLEKLNNGKAVVISKSSAIIGGIITIIIFVVTNIALAGVWKGGIDEQIKNRPTYEETHKIAKDELKDMKDDIKEMRNDIKILLKEK